MTHNTPSQTCCILQNRLFCCRESGEKYASREFRARIEHKHATADNGEKLISNVDMRNENKKAKNHSICDKHRSIHVDDVQIANSPNSLFNHLPYPLCIVINSIESCHCYGLLPFIIQQGKYFVSGKTAHLLGWLLTSSQKFMNFRHFELKFYMKIFSSKL